MEFKEALQKLNIEDYGKRIFNSNSHGELFHLIDYCVIADALKEDGYNGFREWFVSVIKYAEENWDRPESVFQHIPKFIKGDRR